MAAPFRPGELPATVALHLAPETHGPLEQEASDRGVPLSLWLRIAVEAARGVDEIVAATGRTRREVEDALDASRELASAWAPDAESDLSAYVEALSGGRTGASRGTGVVLRLSSEIASSWKRCAGLTQLSLEAWVVHCLERRPADAVQWEIAAASEGRTLAEWLYASALRAPRSLASSSA